MDELRVVAFGKFGHKSRRSAISSFQVDQQTGQSYRMHPGPFHFSYIRTCCSQWLAKINVEKWEKIKVYIESHNGIEHE